MASIVDIFPLEIIEHIIDIVAFDDHYKAGPPFQFLNVKACALTCRAFYLRSRYQRFRAIKIYDRETYVEPSIGSITLDDFERFVKTNPEGAQRLIELHYSIRGRAYRPPIDEAVSQILTNLQALVLSPYHGSMDWVYTVPWYNPKAKEQKDTLMQILHLPTLISLKVTRAYNFQPSDLFPCTNLQSLSLQSVSTLAEDDTRFVPRRAIPIEGAVPIRLRHLEVGGSAIRTVAEMIRPAIVGESPILDLEHLKDLDVKGGLDEDYFPYIEKIFETAPKLQHIRFEVGRQSPFEDVHSSLPFLIAQRKTLRSLSLDLYLHEPINADRPENLHSLHTTLLKLDYRTSRNKIKSLQVQIRFGPHDRFGSPRRIQDLNTLGQIFFLSEAWPHLIHFDLAIIVQGQSSERKFIIKVLSDYPNTHFARLSSQKKIQIHFLLWERRGLCTEDNALLNLEQLHSVRMWTT